MHVQALLHASMPCWLLAACSPGERPPEYTEQINTPQPHTSPRPCLPEDIFEWATERGTRFYSLAVTGDDIAERGLAATVPVPLCVQRTRPRVFRCVSLCARFDGKLITCLRVGVGTDRRRCVAAGSPAVVRAHVHRCDKEIRRPLEGETRMHTHARARACVRVHVHVHVQERSHVHVSRVDE